MELLARLKQGMPELPATQERGLKRLWVYARAVLEFRGEPRWIALSFAVGIFISLNPFYGTHTLSLLLLIPLLRLHPLGTLIGSLGNPPMVAAVFYPFAFGLGKVLLIWLGLPGGDLPPDFSFQVLVDLIGSREGLTSIFLPLVIGSTVLGLVASIIGYLVVFRAVIRVRGRNAGDDPVALERK